ncbi:protein RESPONSE TO ABA AND SALT 1-like [Euphorbia lathyris]|uniref:protein RESPONSE TO ABA AND SALT 1-like n=1 Tax=Euphorbia lathyris TaxID=212925 RepID=UPI003313AE3B
MCNHISAFRISLPPSPSAFFIFNLMHNGSGTASCFFQEFFDGWLVRQQHCLQELLSLYRDQHTHEFQNDDLKDVVTRILAHYEQYYQEKSRLAHRNIYLVFSPPWFTPFERTFLWIAGFKPALTYRVLHTSVLDLSEEQRQLIGRLKEETKLVEKMLHDEMARVQESVASPPLLEWAKRHGRMMDGETRSEGSAIERIGLEMEAVVGRADALRMSTVMRVVEILTPKQNVKFLTAVTELQSKIRNIGMQRR